MTYPGSMDPGIHGSMDLWIPGTPESDIPRIQYFQGFGSFDRSSSKTPTTHETFYHFLTFWESFFRTGYFWTLPGYPISRDPGYLDTRYLSKQVFRHRTVIVISGSGGVSDLVSRDPWIHGSGDPESV